MLQSLATMVFAAAALSALFMISALIAAEWGAVRLALGLREHGHGEPPKSPVRAMPARRIPMLRVIPAEVRRAA